MIVATEPGWIEDHNSGNRVPQLSDLPPRAAHGPQMIQTRSSLLAELPERPYQGARRDRTAKLVCKQCEASPLHRRPHHVLDETPVARR